MSKSLPASYKNLIVYKKAKQLTIDVLKYFSHHRLTRLDEIPVNQVVRAIASIGANIAEGYGRHSPKSYRHFIGIARGSSFEADYWLDVISETNHFDSKTIPKFIQRNTELIKILTTMMKNLEDRT